jgi:DNA polymerase-3 subunit epsilon
MRQIIVDTETTGLEPALGHRIIEIGAVEITNRRHTSRTFHQYLNPQREVDAAALRVHGLTAEFLGDKPRFADVVNDFLDFVDGAELVIHNAAFDIAFLDYELSLIGLPAISSRCAAVIDTLKLAREMHPGKRNALDALCERYAINNAHRTLHGALLDAQLLAEVYLAMTRGQESLIVEPAALTITLEPVQMRTPGLALAVIRANAAEAEEHEAQLRDIQRASAGACLWTRLAHGGVALAGCA